MLIAHSKPTRILVRIAVIIGFLSAPGFSEPRGIEQRVVRVTAERFAFTPSEIEVAPGTEVEFQLKSEDTAHGFRILGHGVDVAIPKRGRGELSVRFTPPSAGRYVFECSRMCGAGHSFMRGTLIVRAPSSKDSR
jgi:cytochrome c oxidase subunit 2